MDRLTHDHEAARRAGLHLARALELETQLKVAREGRSSAVAELDRAMNRIDDLSAVNRILRTRIRQLEEELQREATRTANAEDRLRELGGGA